jgi:hypothetical protein
VHGSWFTGAINAQAYDIQLGEAISQAQAAMTSLKAKIDQAEKLPRTPAGLPRKEGL